MMSCQDSSSASLSSSLCARMPIPRLQGTFPCQGAFPLDRSPSGSPVAGLCPAPEWCPMIICSALGFCVYFSTSCPHILWRLGIANKICSALGFCVYLSTSCPHILWRLGIANKICSALGFCVYLSTSCPHILWRLGIANKICSALGFCVIWPLRVHIHGGASA